MDARGDFCKVGKKTFEVPQDWEDTTADLLAHWGAGVERRISDHENMANKARMIEVIRLPLLLFALIMSALSLIISAESRATAFAALGLAQIVYMVLDPSGWRERHMTFAERYAELFQEISDTLDKPSGSRKRKGGPPISTLVTRRQSHYRQGFAGDEFVKPPLNDKDESVPWKEGSQQSQLLLVVACRLNKLEGSRPRALVDWTYSPILTGT